MTRFNYDNHIDVLDSIVQERYKQHLKYGIISFVLEVSPALRCLLDQKYVNNGIGHDKTLYERVLEMDSIDKVIVCNQLKNYRFIIRKA